MFKVTIAEADELAYLAHSGQVDKSGEPYFDHVARVAHYVRGAMDLDGGWTGPQIELAVCAAYLHDVLEDTEIDKDRLLSMTGDEELVEIVDALTHRKNEPRVEYIARVKQNQYARLVKYFDIVDNTNPSRLDRLDRETRARLVNKYERDLKQLMEDDNADR